ncbi:MAG: hypothetical protein ACUVX8_11695 [Candidatus Zipacnadales bacterium]
MKKRVVRVVVVLALSSIMSAVLASAAFADRHRIVIEAEHYNAINPSTRVVAGDSTASGGKYTEYPLKRPHATSENPAVKGDGGYILFKITIPESGNYALWVRMWAFDGCGNSYFVVVDDKPPQTIAQTTYKTWKWTKATQLYALTAGVHTVKIQNREDGARCDQILLTNDLKWQPVSAMAETPQYRVTE